MPSSSTGSCRRTLWQFEVRSRSKPLFANALNVFHIMQAASPPRPSPAPAPPTIRTGRLNLCLFRHLQQRLRGNLFALPKNSFLSRSEELNTEDDLSSSLLLRFTKTILSLTLIMSHTGQGK